MSRIQLPAKYLCQWDNTLEPQGTCNMTSAAMALASYGCKVPGRYSRMSDNLTQLCLDKGWDRHELSTIDRVMTLYGIDDNAGYTVTFDQLKAHLRNGNLAIVQGMFTALGHVVLVKGFDENAGKWNCNDPAGAWPHYSEPGWLPGKDVWYASEWFRAKAAPDGKLWAHLVSKKGQKPHE